LLSLAVLALAVLALAVLALTMLSLLLAARTLTLALIVALSLAPPARGLLLPAPRCSVCAAQRGGGASGKRRSRRRRRLGLLQRAPAAVSSRLRGEAQPRALREKGGGEGLERVALRHQACNAQIFLFTRYSTDLSGH